VLEDKLIKETDLNIYIEKAKFIPHYWFYNDIRNKKEPEIIT
jgi:hypothetical protein